MTTMVAMEDMSQNTQDVFTTGKTAGRPKKYAWDSLKVNGDCLVFTKEEVRDPAHLGSIRAAASAWSRSHNAKIVSRVLENGSLAFRRIA